MRFLLLLFTLPLFSLQLQDNLEQAKPGDWLVSQFDHTYTVLCIRENRPPVLIFDEIATPMKQENWREWITKEAPGSTSWVTYSLDTTSGGVQSCFSHTKNGWVHIPKVEQFFATLLKLSFSEIPNNERKKRGRRPLTGVPDRRPMWQPTMVHEGQVIPDVPFDAYLAAWPDDGSELAGKTVEAYLPQGDAYPAYYPFWLQVRGWVGKGTVHMIDSGNGMRSPKPLHQRNTHG
ncbi:MAG: hypothetical protein KDK65_03870 [Chlamydiia bacterium]|nr:hypothetical protein [Chlamydiia bacterium]